MKSAHISDLLPAYVLGSLNIEERQTVGLHLSECESCRKELTEYKIVLDHLGTAIPIVDPHPNLKVSVIQRVVESRQRLESTRPSVPPLYGLMLTIRDFLARPMGIAVVGLMLLLILFLTINTFSLTNQISILTAAIPADGVRLVQVSGTDHSPSTTGYLMLIKNETSGTFAIHDAPILDTSHQYQLWLIKDGIRTSGGVFSVTSQGYGTLLIELDTPLENFQSFGITIEPIGGSTAPTGAKILGGNL